MTKTLFAVVTALILSAGMAIAAPSSNYGQQAQTGAYAAGSQWSSTPMNDGGGAR